MTANREHDHLLISLGLSKFTCIHLADKLT